MNRMLLLLSSSLSVLAACTSAPDAVGPPPCDGIRHAVEMDSIEAGFSAAEVLALVEGRHSKTAEATDGATETVVDVAYSGGRVLRCEDAGIAAHALVSAGPQDRLDIQVDITLSSHDDVFEQEMRSVFVAAWAPNAATTTYPIFTDELNGKRRPIHQSERAGVFEEPGGAFQGPMELSVGMMWSEADFVGAVMAQNGSPVLAW